MTNHVTQSTERIEPKVIIFDLDGVLVNTAELGNKLLFKVYPTVTQAEIDEMLMGNMHDGMEKIKQKHVAVVATEEEIAARKKEYAEEKARAPMFAGMKELVQRMHAQGYMLAVNTSSRLDTCVPILAKNAIDTLFSVMGTTELSKSKIEKFKLIEQKLGSSNKNTVFITDTIGDVREAELAGVPTIAVTWGSHQRSLFERERNLVALVSSVEELERAIMDFYDTKK